MGTSTLELHECDDGVAYHPVDGSGPKSGYGMARLYAFQSAMKKCWRPSVKRLNSAESLDDWSIVVPWIDTEHYTKHDSQAVIDGFSGRFSKSDVCGRPDRAESNCVKAQTLPAS